MFFTSKETKKIYRFDHVVAEKLAGEVYFVFFSRNGSMNAFPATDLNACKAYQAAKARGKGFYDNGCPVKEVAMNLLCEGHL